MEWGYKSGPIWTLESVRFSYWTSLGCFHGKVCLRCLFGSWAHFGGRQVAVDDAGGYASGVVEAGVAGVLVELVSLACCWIWLREVLAGKPGWTVDFIQFRFARWVGISIYVHDVLSAAQDTFMIGKCGDSACPLIFYDRIDCFFAWHCVKAPWSCRASCCT